MLAAFGPKGDLRLGGFHVDAESEEEVVQIAVARNELPRVRVGAADTVIAEIKPPFLESATRAAAAGGWIDDMTLLVEARAVETPYVVMIRIDLDGDTVDLRIEQNLSFDPVKSWRLVGGIASGEK